MYCDDEDCSEFALVDSLYCSAHAPADDVEVAFCQARSLEDAFREQAIPKAQEESKVQEKEKTTNSLTLELFRAEFQKEVEIKSLHKRVDEVVATMKKQQEQLQRNKEKGEAAVWAFEKSLCDNDNDFERELHRHWQAQAMEYHRLENESTITVDSVLVRLPKLNPYHESIVRDYVEAVKKPELALETDSKKQRQEKDSKWPEPEVCRGKAEYNPVCLKAMIFVTRTSKRTIWNVIGMQKCKRCFYGNVCVAIPPGVTVLMNSVSTKMKTTKNLIDMFHKWTHQFLFCAR